MSAIGKFIPKSGAECRLHRHFNALQLVNTHQVSYKPFHNQLRKESFALFMKALGKVRIGREILLG
ncbi:hypothetical protein ACET85_20530 [Aeromonas veronii]